MILNSVITIHDSGGQIQDFPTGGAFFVKDERWGRVQLLGRRAYGLI